MNLLDVLHGIKQRWGILLPILVVDAIAMVFGWYYYWDVGQFRPGSSYFLNPLSWPLVSDSPNAVLLFFVAVLVHKLTGWRSKWLDGSAFILNVYVGGWTTLLFLLYPERMGTFDWGSTNNILFFAHLGMPLQALVLLRDLRRDTWKLPELAAVVAGAALYLWVDYGPPNWHPAPFLHPDDAALHAGSMWLMAGVLAVTALVVFTARGPPKTSTP